MTAALTEDNSTPTDAGHVDVLIIGAGLSGIGAAHRLTVECPWASFAVLEARHAIGGTWDLFRYPGVRSDSDMFTFGYELRPWDRDESIGRGADIRQYIEDTARETGVDQHIRFGHKVIGASWSSEEARWTVQAQQTETGEVVTLTADFVHSCAGYYRYDRGYTPDFAGRDDFQGDVIHPQFWPEDLDYRGKRVVIIGSGATAITLLPSMSEQAGHVVQLQRTPSYLFPTAGKSPAVAALRRVLPQAVTARLLRWGFAVGTQSLYDICRKWPDWARNKLKGYAASQLPDDYDVDTHFNPPYEPWDQRLCVTPDHDYFRALRSGKAEVVTDTIERFTPAGILLTSGRELEADIIVTATGLELQFMGDVEALIDGEPVEIGHRMVYKATMIEGVPNFSFVVGYTNASWGLRADLSNKHLTTLLNEMRRQDMAKVVPRNMDGDVQISDEPLLNLTSGYITRSAHLMPSQGSRRPWKVGERWLNDRREMGRPVIGDGLELSVPRSRLRQKAASV
jgi:cation diffusion facilitator CzcD-associated flavoprotein CzcO